MGLLPDLRVSSSRPRERGLLRSIAPEAFLGSETACQGTRYYLDARGRVNIPTHGSNPTPRPLVESGPLKPIAPGAWYFLDAGDERSLGWAFGDRTGFRFEGKPMARGRARTVAWSYLGRSADLIALSIRRLWLPGACGPLVRHGLVPIPAWRARIGHYGLSRSSRPDSVSSSGVAGLKVVEGRLVPCSLAAQPVCKICSSATHTVEALVRRAPWIEWSVRRARGPADDTILLRLSRLGDFASSPGRDGIPSVRPPTGFDHGARRGAPSLRKTITSLDNTQRRRHW